MMVTLKTQLPNRPATPRSYAFIRAAAIVAEASGIVVTIDTAIIPSTPDDIPVMSAIWSVLIARKMPPTTTPADTTPNYNHALVRVNVV